MKRLLARIALIPTLCWNVLLGRILRIRNWWDRIDEHLILGARPFPSDVEALAAAGVKGVVNTCEEYAGPLAAYQKVGIEQLHIPTVDFTPPSYTDILAAIVFIDRVTSADASVYIHCKAGRARSATIALCWLLHAKNMTPEQAQNLLLTKRPHVSKHLVERAVVQQFWRSLGKGENTKSAVVSRERS